MANSAKFEVKVDSLSLPFFGGKRDYVHIQYLQL